MAPAHLAAGVIFWWRVQAFDPVDGTMSPWSAATSFTPVSSTSTLYTLSIGMPADCAVVNRNPVLAAASDSGAGAVQLLLRTTGSLRGSPDTLTLEATRPPGGVVSGSIGGSATPAGIGANVPTHQLRIAADTTLTGRAPLTGRVNADGSMSGTFSGYIRYFQTGPSGSDGGQCSSDAFTWSVTARP
jgi:hypothetical protein